MSFNFKSLIKGLSTDASVALNRAVQFTGEKLGTSERTELDSNYESLAEKADKTKNWTERIVANTEAVLEPNPSNRAEDFLFEKIDKKRGPERMRNLEWLGADMVSAGIEFGPATVYGSTLIKVGQTQQKLGEAEKEFVSSAYNGFVGPLHSFLNWDMKQITKERKLLEAKRLDLDAAKNRLKKAKTAEYQASSSSRNPLQPKSLRIEEEIEQAEREIQTCQVDFDRQVEVTRVLMEGLGATHNKHVELVGKYVECQIAYYNKCQKIMAELQSDLSSSLPLTTTGSKSFYVKSVDVVAPASSSGSSSDTNKALTTEKTSNKVAEKDESVVKNGGTNELRNGAQLRDVPLSPKNSMDEIKVMKARVVCDFSPTKSDELAVSTGEILSVTKLPSDDPDWMLCVKDSDASKQGKVPLAYLEILS